MEFITQTGKRTVSVSLIKTQQHIVYDCELNACSVTVSAHTVENAVRQRKISTAVFRYLKDRMWYPHHIEVLTEYQRRGVAQTMYDIVQGFVPGRLVASDEQSTAAKMFWQARSQSQRIVLAQHLIKA